MSDLSTAPPPLPISSYRLNSTELDLISFLLHIGAFRTRHSSHYSLASHLIGTYGLLHLTSAPLPTALSGGLHSIYGTIRFPQALLNLASEEDRERVREHFGEEAERLAHTFCSINRPMGLEELSSTLRRKKGPTPSTSQEQQGKGKNVAPHELLPQSWEGEKEIEAVQLEPSLVQQLRLLDAANLIEQGEEETTLPRLPNIQRVWKEHLLSHLHTHPSFPTLPSPPLFARFLHFHVNGLHLPCVRLTSLNLSDFEAFHAELLRAVVASSPGEGEGEVGHPVIHRVRLPKGGMTGEAEPHPGTDYIPFVPEEVHLLASNAPCPTTCSAGGEVESNSCCAYELLLVNATGER